MVLTGEELQRKSEELKKQKIKQIKHNLKSNCLSILKLPNEIEDIIISYSFDESEIETNKSLKAKIKKYYKTKNEYLISKLDVSCVTSMSYLFEWCNEINQPLDKWDTSNVVNMSGMFVFCKKFNQPIDFNTKNVTNMSGMFSSCIRFNQPVNFNTKNVTNMSCMFYGCTSFNQLVNFDTKNVTNMLGMFDLCKSLKESNKLLIIH